MIHDFQFSGTTSPFRLWLSIHDESCEERFGLLIVPKMTFCGSGRSFQEWHHDFAGMPLFISTLKVNRRETFLLILNFGGKRAIIAR
jgi:hypothetical protein